MTGTKRLVDVENSFTSQQKELYKKILAEASNRKENTRYHKMSYQEYFTQIRYMISIGYYAAFTKLDSRIMFIGGLGVLGNILAQLARHPKPLEDYILAWRGTPDLDMVFKDRQAISAIHLAFDELLQPATSKSHSIPNKLSLAGKCVDTYTNRNLSIAQIDICIPDASNQISLGGTGMAITEQDWKQKKTVNLFGINLHFLGCIPLLNAKLSAACDSQSIRGQDMEDIAHLLAIAEREGRRPDMLTEMLTAQSRKNLLGVLPKLYYRVPTKDLIMTYSYSYKNDLLSTLERVVNRQANTLTLQPR